MTRRRNMLAPVLLAAAMTAIVAAPMAGGQPVIREGPSAGATSASPRVAPAAPVDYSARLSVLDPGRPLGYFELAEEIASEDRTATGRELARRLYVLSILAPRAPQPPSQPNPPAPAWLPQSACLGLAALAENEQERRWLTALAGTLTPADSAVAPARQAEVAMRDAAALNLATALGLIRVGEGRRATRLLDNAAVASLLTRYEGLLNPGGLSGGGERVRSLADRFGPCQHCRNRRYVKDAEGVHLCPTCQGRPGPKLSVPELIGQLRMESLLLNGVQRSWAAQTVADGGAPMRELDPRVLADVYGVDAAKCVWRSGTWVSPLGDTGPSKGAETTPAAPETLKVQPGATDGVKR